jgi:hypothetical protein
MFYVGVHVVYEGADKARFSKVRLLDKLGRAQGRAERFLVNNPPVEKQGLRYRAMVLVLPPKFVLRNDMIQAAVKAYQCDWQTAKFHVYRLAAVNVLGKQDVWADVMTAASEAEAAKQSTDTVPEPVNPANEPIVNPNMDKIQVL